MKCIIFYTIGNYTEIRWGNQYRRFDSVKDFYDLLINKNITYAHNNVFSINSIAVNETDIKYIFKN